MGELPRMLFKQLKIIRVYAKPPGKKPDMNEPFTIPEGSTVLDLARMIHRELAEKLKTARIWGTGFTKARASSEITFSTTKILSNCTSVNPPYNRLNTKNLF